MAVPRVSIFDVDDYEAQVDRAAEILTRDGVVVLPTETVYGAAGVLNNPISLAKLKAIRGGDLISGKPFTIHLAHRDDAAQYIGKTSDFANRLMRKLWPGPVGLRFDVPAERRREVAERLKVPESELYDGSAITLRCPDHVVTADILGLVPAPVVLTMAGTDNLRADTLSTELEGLVDLVIDAGPTRFSKPSTLLKVMGDKYEIVRAGVYDERIIDKMLKTTILFVCSGNTCRSPMAEAIARRVLTQSLHMSEMELEHKGISVVSAGSFAMPGARATPAAVEAVKDLGADLSKHRSRPLSVELIHQADVIYTMGRSHAHAVLSLVPSAAEKVQTLDPKGDIEDPIGGDDSLYRELAGYLQTLIEKRLSENPLV